MYIPTFRRKTTGLDYVDNAYEIKKETMNLVSRLSTRWLRIYQQPIDRLACFQSDLVMMAYSITPTNYEEFVIRRLYLKMSRSILQALEKRIMDVVEALYSNPTKVFNRKNGKNYPYREAVKKLDEKLEDLGVKYGRQYELIKGVLNNDNKKYKDLKREDIDDTLVIKNIGIDLVKVLLI